MSDVMVRHAVERLLLGEHGPVRCEHETPAAEPQRDPVRELLSAAKLYREMGRHDVAAGCEAAAFDKAEELSGQLSMRPQ